MPTAIDGGFEQCLFPGPWLFSGSNFEQWQQREHQGHEGLHQALPSAATILGSLTMFYIDLDSSFQKVKSSINWPWLS